MESLGYEGVEGVDVGRVKNFGLRFAKTKIYT